MRALSVGSFTFALATLGLTPACGTDRPVAPQPMAMATNVIVDAGAEAGPLDGAAPADAATAAAVSLASSCPALKPGEVSDDDHPRVSGVGDVVNDPLAWFAAHGIERRMVAVWAHQDDARHGVKGADSYGIASGDTAGFDQCSARKVGSPAEDALFCERVVPGALYGTRGVVIVVRAGHLAVVLDVGLDIRAADFPDARWLDLGVAFNVDGTTVEVGDRAPDGSRLVEAPSVCRAREAATADCARRLKLSEPSHGACPHGCDYQTIDGCQVLEDGDGHRYLAPAIRSQELPASMHDCDGAHRQILDIQREVGASSQAAVYRQALQLQESYCRMRGHWTWQRDHFASIIAEQPLHASRPRAGSPP